MVLRDGRLAEQGTYEELVSCWVCIVQPWFASLPVLKLAVSARWTPGGAGHVLGAGAKLGLVTLLLGIFGDVFVAVLWDGRQDTCKTAGVQLGGYSDWQRASPARGAEVCPS